jgi:galactokinase
VRATRWFAPGRVNLSGEHTDYNAGLALPFAIEQGCTATVEPTRDGTVVAVSAQRDGAVTTSLSALATADIGWADYVCGVVWALQRLGFDVPGLRVSVESTVPMGAGLASSAALLCSVATAIDDAFGLRLRDDELLAVTRSAENDFVGAPTGGLDQLASLRCRAGHALLCDFRDLTTQQVGFDLGAADLAVLVIDTRTQHAHATGEYAARRAACEQAARQLGVPTLRDVYIDELAEALLRLDNGRLWRSVRHVVTENDRVAQAFTFLDQGELAAVGPLLTESHESLRDDYRVSVPQLDVAVETALQTGAFGARMTGGGFGGCVIALLPRDLVDVSRAAVTAAFAARGFTAPRCFPTRPGPGAHRVD